MSNIPTSRSSSPAAQRMRRYRKQRRQGLRYIPIPLHETDIDAFIRLGLLKDVYRAADDLAWGRRAPQVLPPIRPRAPPPDRRYQGG
jgi:hypothetical protein